MQIPILKNPSKKCKRQSRKFSFSQRNFPQIPATSLNVEKQQCIVLNFLRFLRGMALRRRWRCRADKRCSVVTRIGTLSVVFSIRYWFVC